MTNKQKDLTVFSKERVLEIIKSALQSPLEPTDAYGMSLKARVQEAMKAIKKLK